jgi:hypothetical protein
MLRRHERRTLDEIERRLSAEEPELARELATAELPTPPPSRMVSLLTWFSLGTGVMCLFLGQLGACAVVASLVGVLLGLRRWRLHA